MKLTTKLLSHLNRVFKKDPKEFLALRLQYGGIMTWNVADGILTTSISGGIGAPLIVTLSNYTLSSLVSYLAAQPGYTVAYVDGTPNVNLSASVLLDASGNPSASNGDHLYGYTSSLFSYFESVANELTIASGQISQMLLQLSSTSAGGEWLDEIGSYYNVPRISGELDPVYSNRIIAEVLRPRGNAMAISASLSFSLGYNVDVNDVVVYSGGVGATTYNGALHYDGTQHYNSTGAASYGLFDASFSYDLLSGVDMAGFTAMLRIMIENIRDAGTQLRALALIGTVPLTDSASSGTDSGFTALSAGILATDAATGATETLSAIPVAMGALLDSASTGADSASITVSTTTLYNGFRNYNGSTFYSSGSPFTAALP